MMNSEIDLSPVFVRESYGLTHRRLYQISSQGNNIKYNIKEESKQWQSLTSFFMTVFLPHGFPESVSNDYLQYQIWDSVQAFASSITGSICTHAVLKGVGVGDESASALAATITWLIKDGTSMVGRIIFAWFKGTKLDCDCKKWRLFADVLNDTAMLLDLMSAYFPKNFTFIICTSGIFKSVVGVAGGSTRAALTQHQARHNNMADVSAKDGSQETLVNLLALICSLVIIPFVTKSFILTWFVFSSMTVIHLISNYFAVKSVVMETFNGARFEIFTRHYFIEGVFNQKFLSIDEVNKQEKVFFSMLPQAFSIRLGSPFKDIIEDKSYEEIKELLNLYQNCDYLLSVTKKRHLTVINISLNRRASVETQLESLYQAHFLKYLIEDKNLSKEAIKGNSLYFEISSRDYTLKTFKDFLYNVRKKGFKTDNIIFDSNIWKVDW